MNTSTFVRFDWYQATLPADVPVNGLEGLLSAGLGDAFDIRRPMYGYGLGYDVLRAGSRVASVFQGHGKGDHIQVSGADSPEVAAAVRRLYPGHSVARADACVDFDQGPEFFPEACRQARLLAGDAMKVRTISEEYQGQTATTLYLGSTKSETTVRLYEKGKQDPEHYAPDTVRMEVQVRPANAERKRLMATTAPADVFGWGRVSRRLAAHLAGYEPLPAPARDERAASELDQALDVMCHQYGNRLRDLMDRHQGDLVAFALDLMTRVGD